MKRKPIRIDWNDLEAAFENKREDLVFYLDLVTGQVVLDGEGEEAAFDDGGPLDEAELGPEAPPRDDTTRLYVEPPTEEQEIAWMEDFLVDRASQLGGTASGSLDQALNGEDPAESFRETLRQFPAERDLWFLYRTDRLHERIDAWLESKGVQSAEPPPWRG